MMITMEAFPAGEGDFKWRRQRDADSVLSGCYFPGDGDKVILKRTTTSHVRRWWARKRPCRPFLMARTQERRPCPPAMPVTRGPEAGRPGLLTQTQFLCTVDAHGKGLWDDPKSSVRIGRSAHSPAGWLRPGPGPEDGHSRHSTHTHTGALAASSQPCSHHRGG